MHRDCYYSDKTLAVRYDVRRQTIWDWVRNGRFPAPVRFSPQCARWHGGTVLDHEAKVAEAA